MKMEPLRSSETSAIKTQTLWNYPKRNILQLCNFVCKLVSSYVSRNRVKEDEMNGAAYEDKATVEWIIFRDVDRFCGANRCKTFCVENVGHHVACDWCCNLYMKRAFWCSIEIAYRYKKVR